MDAKEAIIQAAIDLINEKGEDMNTITVRPGACELSFWKQRQTDRIMR